MIIASDVALRDFISNAKECAITLINSKSNEIVFHNEMAATVMGGDIKGCRLFDIMERQSLGVSISEILFCDYVHSISLIEKPSPVLAVERFNEEWFTSIRFSVYYEGSECIMAIILKSINNHQGNSVYLLDGREK
ncbi:MAG: hypothetical protein ACRC9E_09055 [Plesiomonas shigelloides]